MDTSNLLIKFARIGARLKVADRPSRRLRTASGVVSEFLRGGAPCLQAWGGAAPRNVEINKRILITGPFPVQSGHRPWALLREQR